MATVGKQKRINLERQRGDTKPFRYQMLDENLDPIDILGMSALMTVTTEKAPTDASSQVFQLTGTQENPTTLGIWRFIPSAIEADQDPNDKYYYDIQITDAAGLLDSPVGGKLRFKQDQTK